MPGKYYSVREALRRLNESNIDEDYEDPLSELDPEDDDEPITEEDKIFEQAMFEFFAELSEQEDLTEDFKNKDALKNHYLKHCLADNPNKVSNRYTVYYDFTNKSDYAARERSIMNNVNTQNAIFVLSLQDKDYVIECFHKLFEGNTTLVFTNMCGLRDNKGQSVSVIFNSFSTDVTTNYHQDTIDYMIVQNRSTKTMFPLDVTYVQNKFNNVVKRTFSDLHFDINH